MEDKQQDLPAKPQGFPKWLGRIAAIVLFVLAAFVALAMFGGDKQSESQPQVTDSPFK